LPCRSFSSAIGHTSGATFLGTVGAAINLVTDFNPVTDDPAIAMGTARSEEMNGAFKTVEMMFLPLLRYREGFIVIISANVAFHVSSFVEPAEMMATQLDRFCRDRRVQLLLSPVPKPLPPPRVRLRERQLGSG
jgi:hypothetical protein